MFRTLMVSKFFAVFVAPWASLGWDDVYGMGTPQWAEFGNLGENRTTAGPCGRGVACDSLCPSAWLVGLVRA